LTFSKYLNAKYTFKIRFERLAMEEENPAPRTNGEKFRVRRFKVRKLYLSLF
jgi:hypothetical protein